MEQVKQEQLEPERTVKDPNWKDIYRHYNNWKDVNNKLENLQIEKERIRLERNERSRKYYYSEKGRIGRERRKKERKEERDYLKHVKRNK